MQVDAAVAIGLASVFVAWAGIVTAAFVRMNSRMSSHVAKLHDQLDTQKDYVNEHFVRTDHLDARLDPIRKTLDQLYSDLKDFMAERRRASPPQ